MLFGLLVAIMQFSDPLGEVPLSAAVLFWSTRLVAVAVSLVLAEWLLARFATQTWNSPAWLKPAVLSMVITALPMTAIETVLEVFVPQAAPYDDTELRATAPLLAFLGEYLTILSVILPLNVLLWVLIDQRRQSAPAEPVEPERPAFLDKTNGIDLDDVIALGAEEHYVRVKTRSRSELVYGRLADAIAQMPASLGMQVHRSWWVADAAVVAARRGERRYRLELCDGSEVPVSDRFAKAARDRGLIKRRAPRGAARSGDDL